MMYRIAWRYKANTNVHYGKWKETDKNLKSWIEMLNEDYPDMHHWIEEKQ